MKLKLDRKRIFASRKSDLATFGPVHYGPEQPDVRALIIYFQTSSGVSERASEQINERSGAREQSKRGGASK